MKRKKICLYFLHFCLYREIFTKSKKKLLVHNFGSKNYLISESKAGKMCAQRFVIHWPVNTYKKWRLVDNIYYPPEVSKKLRKCLPNKHSSLWRRLQDVLKTSFVFVFRRRLDQNEYIGVSHTSSEYVLKTSWSTPIYSSWPYVFKMSSRRFQDVFKTSYKNVFKTSSRCIQDVLQASS